ncbi:MAG: diadenylate cyclase CdaA [Candidatus Kapabacteria bacterium]|jgi:diadenylate cyclase|nr:diadenylate cyclase CdaA [Candidatus Kapabacteria bacterium]
MNELFRIGFLSVTWVDALDVALIAIIFFLVWRALRDTVAVQILVALVFILALSFITESANLKTVNWVLRRIADVGLVAFIILFQPELRRVLLLLTQTRLFRWFMRTSNQETIDDVVEAATDMAAKHIGALIVFSRAEHVKVTVETGIVLQAAVSAELLLSIFNPRSPLHDGAVVIDNTTVIAARCVLPLSSQQRLGGRILGTRHRAGLGLSEQADVVVLIVSEETGKLSIAYQGELDQSVTAESLKETLSTRLAALAAS